MIGILTSIEGCRFKSADQNGMSTLPACSSEVWLYNHPWLSPTKRQVFPASVVDYIMPIEYDTIVQDKDATRTQKARTEPRTGACWQYAREVDE